jgi:WXG100 family type VII secretion target
MSAPLIRVDYEALNKMSQLCALRSDETREMLQTLRAAMDALDGNWVGRGSNAFFSEMQSDILPATERLGSALESASSTITEVTRIMREAEEEAARPFGSGEAGLLGGISDFVGGVVDDVGDAISGAGKAISDAYRAYRVAEVKKLIDAGDKQGAIDTALRLYGIDTTGVKGTPTYNAATSGEGETSKDGTVTIGDAAYSSPGWLASSVGHEALHARQSTGGRWYTDKDGAALNEVEAYDWEIANADSNGLSRAEVAELTKRRKAYYDTMSAAVKARADRGVYTTP